MLKTLNRIDISLMYLAKIGRESLRTGWAVLLLIVMTNIALSDDETSVSHFLFQTDQAVQGNGFSSVYNSHNTGQMEMDKKAYGSGSYNYESMIKVQKDTTYNEKTGYFSEKDEKKIKFDETMDFSYSPMNFDLGGTFKALQLEKLGKEEICVKNYADPVSMNVLFDSASVLSKNLSVNLLLRGRSAFNDLGQKTLADQNGFSNLNVDASLTGIGHMGIIGKHYNSTLISKNEVIDYQIDEDYTGTFQITKMVSQEFNKTIKSNEDEWLTCCSGGVEGMNPLDARYFKSSGGIFDCSCFLAPSST
jgi:hypothetical protein